MKSRGPLSVYKRTPRSWMNPIKIFFFLVLFGALAFVCLLFRSRETPPLQSQADVDANVDKILAPLRKHNTPVSSVLNFSRMVPSTPMPTTKQSLASLFARGNIIRPPTWEPVNGSVLTALELIYENLDKLITAEYERDLRLPPRSSTPLHLPLPKTHIIIHLPKTGGTTWGLLARRNEEIYKFKQFWYHISKPDLPYLPRYVNGTVFGHFRYGTHLFYPNTSYSYITMLRNPVERVLSHYYYHLTEPKDPNHQLAKSMTLEQWIEASKNAHNRQVQFIAGLVYSEPTNYTLALAKHHLRRFGFVGLTERFDDSMVMLKHYLGWRKLKYFTRKQTREKPGKDKIPPRIIELIKEHNRLDMELYELAVELFDEQLAFLSRSHNMTREFLEFRTSKNF